ncbi:MAG: hypothetical protein WC390_08965, partial [Sulfurimonas sp.]
MKRTLIILTLILSISVYAEEPKQRINQLKANDYMIINKEIVNKVNDNFIDIVNNKQNKRWQVLSDIPALSDLSESSPLLLYSNGILSLWARYGESLYELANST